MISSNNRSVQPQCCSRLLRQLKILLLTHHHIAMKLYITLLYLLSRRSEDPINQLCECIGQSEKLFSAFADYCTEKARKESSPTWGRILRNVLTKIQEKKDKVIENVLYFLSPEVFMDFFLFFFYPFHSLMTSLYTLMKSLLIIL